MAFNKGPFDTANSICQAYTNANGLVGLGNFLKIEAIAEKQIALSKSPI